MTRTSAHKRVYKKLRAYTWLYSIFAAAVARPVIVIIMFHSVRVNGDGMAETIINGDIVLFNSIAKHIQTPARGSVVAYRNESGGVEIGRIVALPSESVAVREGSVYINSHLLREEYASPASVDMEAIMLEKGSFFVLPDDRSLLLLSGENAK